MARSARTHLGPDGFVCIVYTAEMQGHSTGVSVHLYFSFLVEGLTVCLFTGCKNDTCVSFVWPLKE